MAVPSTSTLPIVTVKNTHTVYQQHISMYELLYYQPYCQPQHLPLSLYLLPFRRWQAPPALLFIAEMKRNSRSTLPVETGGRPSQGYTLTKNDDGDYDDDFHRKYTIESLVAKYTTYTY